jgi:hypothetical protein
LTGPDGAVEVRTVDNKTTTDKGNLGQYLPSGGIVIPVKPLKPGSSYSATASFTTDGGAALEHSWNFTTSGPAPTPSPSEAACTKAKRDLKSAQATLKRAKARYKRRRTAARQRAVTRAKKRVRSATRRVHSRCS